MTSEATQVRLIGDLFQPTTKQRAALDALKTYRYVLYGGARGGGKSRWLRWSLLALLVRWGRTGHHGVRVGLFSEDYPTLRDRQITKIRSEFPRQMGELRGSQDEGFGFFLTPAYGGGALLLRNLDDPSKYQSAEFAGIGVEELTKNPVETFNILRASLRWPGIDDTKFLAATNPGDIGHLWVKQFWIDRRFPEEMLPLADQFMFVQALPVDNPHLSEQYWTELRTLPAHVRKAWLEGSWDVFEGQALTEWDDAVHVIKTVWRPPNIGWRVIGGMDWGIRAKAVISLAAVSTDGDLIWWRELVWSGKDAYEAGYDVAVQFEQMMAQGLPLPEAVYCDAAMWANTGIGGHTIAGQFMDGVMARWSACPVTWIPAPHGPGSRALKLSMVKKMLSWGPRLKDGTLPASRVPRMRFVGGQVPYLVSSLPALPYDPKNNMDIDTHADDHGYDAVGNVLLMEIEPAERPAKDVPENQHPGLYPDGTRRPRIETEESKVRDALWEAETAGIRPGGRYGLRPGRAP